MRKDLDLILFLSPLLFRKDGPLTLRLPFETPGFAARVALAGENSFSAYVDYRDARILAATRRLTGAPWGLVIKVDEDEALAPFRKDVFRKGLTWGGLLLSLIAAAFGLWRVASHGVTFARSEARFGALVEQATDAIFLIGSDGRVLQANRAAEKIYGRTREELLSLHATDVRASSTRDALRHDMETAAARGSLLVETRHRRADGSELPVEVNLGLVKAGDETLFVSIVRDISARKAAEDRIRALNRLLRTISGVNKLLVRATDEEPFLKEVCRILVSRGGYALAWIGRADRETMRLVPVASAGDQAGYLEEIEVRWDDTPEGRGPLGTAIREGRPAIVSDVQVDSTVGPWRDFMLRHGFGSLAALPVRRGGTVTAGLAVYAEEKAFIDEEEIALLEELAGDISFALDVLDTRARATRSEPELRKLWRAVEQTPATIIMTNLEAQIEYVNPHFTEVTDYTAEEARGQNPRILKSDRTPPEVITQLWETITAGRVWNGELCNRRKDGTHFWEQTSISAVRDDKGTITNYVSVGEDITDRKRAVEDLAKSELYFRSLIENSLDVTAVLDPDGSVRYTSPSVERISGFKPEELAGRSVFELIHQEDRASVEAKLRRVFTKGPRFEHVEFRMRHRDGSWRALSAIGNLLPPETGLRGLILNASDLTESKQLESQLRQAQKMEAIGRLAGGVAHDFNNLLTVIQGYGEIVRDSLSGDPRHESMEEVLKAAGRAASLTRQLLAFSRKQVLEPKVVHLGEIVRETGRMLERLIGENIALVLIATEDLATVKADPGQIEQVVLNLAVNARDAMPNGGQLTVSVGGLATAIPLEGFPDQLPAGRWVLLTVVDTGSGMDAETLSSAFEPFFTTKERGKGTGLGLSTVYGIVRQSDGHVQVTSVPEQGTAFRVYLPRSEEPMIYGAHSAVFAVPGSETVLVVEDEPAVRNLVQAMLERQGYVVLVAEDGAGALDIVDKHPGPIHVLLTDVVMPGMNGHDLAALVRRRRPSIKAILMSGYTADVPTELGTEGGPMFLSKPFSEQALTSKLREALDTPQA